LSEPDWHSTTEGTEHTSTVDVTSATSASSAVKTFAHGRLLRAPDRPQGTIHYTNAIRWITQADPDGS
jgi:hypothetical protein